MRKTLTEQQIRKIIENGTEKAAKVCKKNFYGKPKSLTEQWREGTLPQGNYYIVIRGITEKQKMIDYYIPELHHFEIKPSECILEVLAPVPSYDEYKNLEQQLAELQTEENNLLNDIVDLNLTIENRDKKLAIATKALSDIEDGYSEVTGAGQTVRQAIKEMEGVK